MDGLAAVSWGEGRIDLFWRGDDRALWHRWWDGTAWSDSESLGGVLASGPAVTAWAVDRLEVFAVFDDGQLWDRYWDGAQLARLGVARRRAGHRSGGRPHGVELGRGSPRRLRAGSRRPHLAPLVGRHARGSTGSSWTPADRRRCQLAPPARLLGELLRDLHEERAQHPGRGRERVDRVRQHVDRRAQLDRQHALVDQLRHPGPGHERAEQRPILRGRRPA